MDQVRFGVVGIGNMGSQHVQWLHSGEIQNAALTAVCDDIPSRIENVKQMCGDKIAYFKGYKEMLDSGLIDAVIIATPHFYHPEVALYAFKRSIHVVCEKPAGSYTKQVKEMNRAWEGTGLIFAMMFQWRLHPLYCKAREIIKSGQLGELKRFTWITTNWYRTQAYYDSGGWRATWKGEGGGVLSNQGPHFLDLWQWMFGLPQRVHAECYVGKFHDIECEDDINIYAEYENGATAHFIINSGEAPGTNRLELVGDLGKIVIEDGKLKHWKLDVSEREFCRTDTIGWGAKPNFSYSEMELKAPPPTHTGILQNFVNAILHGEKLISPGIEGIGGVELCNAAYLSSWTNDWVTLPLDDEKYYNLLKMRMDSSKEKDHVVEIVSNLYNK